MKKHIIILIPLFVYSSMLFSQVEKGKFYCAGFSNLGIDIGKTKFESSNGEISEYKYSEFNFSPSIGYFVIDKLVAGLLMDYEYYKNNNQNNDNNYKSTSFVIGPFAKYYFVDYKNIWPYAGFGIGFGSGKKIVNSKPLEEIKLSTFRIGGGATYFINENVGFDLFMGYNKNVDKVKYLDKDKKSLNSSDTDDDIYGEFKISVGVVVSFGEK